MFRCHIFLKSLCVGWTYFVLWQSKFARFFLVVVGLERGLLSLVSLVSSTEELLEQKVAASGLENRD